MSDFIDISSPSTLTSYAETHRLSKYLGKKVVNFLKIYQKKKSAHMSGAFFYYNFSIIDFSP